MSDDWQNTPERLNFDGWVYRRQHRMKALDFAIVYHRDVTKPDYWAKDADKTPPATPGEITETAHHFLRFIEDESPQQPS